MARLPIPGSDDNQWGDILNEYLAQAHAPDGSLKPDAVTSDNISSGSIGLPQLNTTGSPTPNQVLSYNGTSLAWTTVSGGGSVPDADSTTKGLIQLTGHLGGTAANPTVPGLAGKANTSHTHAQSDITGLTASLSSKENTLDAGTSAQYYRGDKSWQALNKAAVGLANVDNTADTAKPISSATQTALNGKAATSHTHTSANITDFTEAAQDVIGSSIVQGTNVTVTYNDGTGQTTISATPGAGVTDLSTTRDAESVTVASSSGDDATLAAVDTSNAGVMTAADKTKLDGIESGAEVNDVDSVAGKTGAVTLTKGDVGLNNVDNTSDTAKRDAYMGTTGTARNLDGDSEVFGHFTVVNDGTASGTWPERLRFNYNDGSKTRRTGYFNEYGEIRAIAARTNTVALRAFGLEYPADGSRNLSIPIFEVADDRTNRTELFAVRGQGDVNAAGNIVGHRSLNTQSGTSYTPVLADDGKMVLLTNAAPVTLTIPPNASVALPIGTQIDLVQMGAGQVTIAPGAGVTVNGTPGLKHRAQYSAVTIIKLAVNTWLAVGDLTE